ncbi:hypothetical protein AB0B94_30655 [Micromonospora sp. NPDC048986]|uniref:hypothetical protein n=1 Tax=Micromonospora sp. NPDC048986 TaxID=3155644 RepID=UPI0033DC5E29
MGPLTTKGQPLGLATLDADGTLAADQIPGGLANITGQAIAVADTVALTSTAASGGDAPTEAEYNALRTDVTNIRTKLNALLAALRTAGVIDT